jgi:hypothetical protein
MHGQAVPKSAKDLGISAATHVTDETMKKTREQEFIQIKPNIPALSRGMLRVFEALNEQLAAAKEKVRLRCKAESFIGHCNEELREARAQAEAAARRLRAEERDLKALQGLSLTHLFYALLGKQGERVEKEQRELLQAKLAYDTAVSLVDRLQYELEDWQRKLEETAGADEEYMALLAKKEHAMQAASDPRIKTLYDLAREEADVCAQLKETEEALEAAEAARDALVQCQESLERAAGWGVIDMLGGGLITTAIKRSHMDDARDLANQAQYCLQRLQRELADVGETSVLKLTSGRFLGFADYFFDGLIVDWMVQGEIRDARDQVSQQLERVEEVRSHLRQYAANLETRRQALVQRRQEWIEAAE